MSPWDRACTSNGGARAPGLPVKICTAEQMRAIDAAAAGDYGIPGMVLMENAGLRLLEVVEELRERDSRVLIVCGGGNNGGDGFVVARHLLNRGANVQVMLLAEAGRVQGDAGANFAIARRMGVPITQAPSSRVLNRAAEEADILVDGILGTGAHGRVRGPALAAVKATQRCRGHVIAVDIPSGISADDGAILGEAVRADITVTFALPKLGLYTYPGRGYCGDIRVADIGIPPALTTDASLRTNLTDACEAGEMLPERPPDGHKADFGRVAVIGGSTGMTGAVALAGEAALRVGAGLVTVGCAEALNAVLEVKLTEAMTRPLPESQPGLLGPECVGAALTLCSEADAVVLGPGLSREPAAQQFARSVIQDCPLPLVIDADALFALADAPQSLTKRKAPTIVTPHPGEMAGLLGTSAGEVQSDRLGAARGLAEATGAVVVLKGAGTVIAEPSGEAWLNPTGSDALASGGTGDVLAGMVGGLLAGGCEPPAAAVAGVYYHGAAGDAAEARGNARSVIAGDLLRTLGDVLPS